MTPKPKCHNTTNPAYTNPTHATPQQITQAITTCHTCPLLTHCAHQALTAGNTPDNKHHQPATDVIMAGIWCKGNKHTTQQLTTITHTPPPTHPTPQPPPTHCKHCHKPMTHWNRTHTTPPGHVMHYARGYCTHCRTHYQQNKNKPTTAPPKQAQ